MQQPAQPRTERDRDPCRVVLSGPGAVDLATSCNAMLPTPVFETDGEGGHEIAVSETTTVVDVMARSLALMTDMARRQARQTSQSSRSLIALRREYLELTRSLGALDDYVAALPVFPRPDVGLPKRQRSSSGDSSAVHVTLEVRSRGLCGIAPALGSTEETPCTIRLYGAESGALFGAWTFDLAAGASQPILNLNRSLTVDEAEVRIEIESPGDAHFIASSASADGSGIDVTTYRWPAGLRTPAGWGLGVGLHRAAAQAALGDGLDGHLAWPSGLDTWTWAQHTSRFKRAKPRVGAGQSFVAKSRSYIQLHPTPQHLALARVTIPTSRDLVVRSYFGHRLAVESLVWVGNALPGDFVDGQPQTGLKERVSVGLRPLEGSSVLDFPLIGGAHGVTEVVLASAVPAESHNEFAWVRFEAPGYASSR